MGVGAADSGAGAPGDHRSRARRRRFIT